MTCTPCATRVSAKYPAATRAAIQARGELANCQNGGIISFSSVFDILATANGTNFTVQVAPVPGGGGAPPAAGDFLRIQPFGSEKYYFHSLQMQPVEAPVGTPIADPFESAAAGTGQMQLNGKEIRPTLQGSFTNHRPAALTTGCEQYQQCGIFVHNGQCLAPLDADNPLDIALVNYNGVDVVRAVITVELEPADMRNNRVKAGVPQGTPAQMATLAAMPAGYNPVG